MESTQHNHSDQAAAPRTAPIREMSAEVLRVVRRLPRAIGIQLRTHPPETVAAIAAGSFVLGAVVGSRLGRLLLAVAVPIAIKSTFEGEVVRAVEKYARQFIRNVESQRQTDA
jgi:hypothetical protein